MNENIKMIETVKDFQTSINISYDLSNKNKIKDFIPTKESIKIIEQLLLGVFESNSNKARILTGAYGRGKSHIVLVFISLLFEKNTEIFENLLSKIKLYNIDLYNFLLNYIKSEKKFFPIIVNGGNNSLQQAFLLGIEEALKKEELLDIMPETNFMSAIKTIEEWKINYKNTYNNFIKEIEETEENFIYSLKNYNLEKYEEFKEIYKKMTSGAIFNPFIGTNVIELYENVNNKLKEKGYQGIYIIYDEFSKYLEANLKISSIKDIKLLQDFAEKCDRNKDINLLLITHKELGNYLDNNLSKEIADSWRGISGRFLQMTLSNDFSEIYEVISSVIKKDNIFWESFKKDNNEKLESLKNILKKEKFLEERSYENIIVEGCYPLHPLTSFILPRISEKIGQNERTLFTFLSSSQKKSLNDFLKNYRGDFKLITPDCLYDYFEIILKNEIHTTILYHNYKILKKVLSKVKEFSLEEKLLKNIFLIYLVDQFDVLPPTKEVIIDTYKYSVDNIEIVEKAIENLEKKECILYLRRSNNHLKIKETSGIDIQKELEKYICKIRNTSNFIDILNSLFNNNYFYPNRYNNEKEITRYFKFSFISGKEFLNTRNWGKKVKQENSDGLIFGIIYKDLEEKKNIEKYLKDKNCLNNQVIFTYLKDAFFIENYVYEYYSAIQLHKISLEDKILQEEYETIIEDLEKIIFNFIEFYTKPEKNKNFYYYMGKKQKISRKSQFLELLSKICEDNFSLTPVINNEVINKNYPSAITIKSRNKIIEKILNGNLEYNLGFRGNGQEIFILRTLLINTGILINKEECTEISLQNVKDDNLRNILDLIELNIKKSSLRNPLNINDIYEQLISIENHIGLRKGIIPIYLAVVFYFYKNNLVIQKEGKDLKLTSDLLSDINNKPDQYTLYLEEWNLERKNYIEKLEKIFEKNINLSEKNYNNYDYLLEGFRRWFLGLPKYTKEVKNQYRGFEFEKQPLDEKILKFRESLKKNIENSREYFFQDLFKIFNCSKFELNILRDIEDTKLELESIIDELEYSLISDLKYIFSNEQRKESTIISILKDWLEDLKEDTRDHIFSKNENKVMNLIENSSNNEKEFIRKLGKIVTSLRLEDWNENIIDNFLNNIKEIKKVIEEFNKKTKNETFNENTYKIIFTGEDGKENTKIFEKVEYSNRAKLLFNEIENSIDEMGFSITDSEKRQVLIEILKKFC